MWCPELRGAAPHCPRPAAGEAAVAGGQPSQSSARCMPRNTAAAVGVEGEDDGHEDQGGDGGGQHHHHHEVGVVMH